MGDLLPMDLPNGTRIIACNLASKGTKLKIFRHNLVNNRKFYRLKSFSQSLKVGKFDHALH